jgi:hypothetical protein
VPTSIPPPPRRAVAPSANDQAEAAKKRAEDAIARVRDKLRHPGAAAEQENAGEQNDFLPSGPIVATTGEGRATPQSADPTSSVVYTAPGRRAEGRALLSEARQQRSSFLTAWLLTLILVALLVLLAIAWILPRVQKNRQTRA